MIDVSGSEDFGSFRSKREYIAELAGVLAFSANENNDKIGVIFFSDTVEKFIPPAKGRKHTLRIIREILSFQPQNKNTNLQKALQFLINAIKKKTIVFLISDFLTEEFLPRLKTNFENLKKSLAVVSRKHDLICLKINDPLESKIDFGLGLVNVVDAETGEQIWLDSSNKEFREQYKQLFNEHQHYIDKQFKHLGIDYVQLWTDKDYVKPLIQLFKKRR